MALADGVTATSLLFGPYTDARGLPDFVGLRGKLTPSTAMLHTASGTVISATPIPVEIGPSGTAALHNLAHTDQPGLASLTRKPFFYTMFWEAGDSFATPGRKDFLLPRAAASPVDYDKLGDIDTSPGLTVPYPSDLYELTIPRGGADTGQVPTLQPNGSLAFAPALAANLVHTQAGPTSSWFIIHNIGRIPAVDLYVGGIQVDADIEATDAYVSVVFPTPTAGTAVLT